MRYVAKLLENKQFLDILARIEGLEADRVYCGHNFAHLMDVARLACLLQKEQGGSLDEEQIYLAALLHDIGRAEEYEYGISHATAGSLLAGEILLHIGYPAEKIKQIQAAIETHRGSERTNTLSEEVSRRAEGEVLQKGAADRMSSRSAELGELLYLADKKSRPCFLCKSAADCNWSEKKKNRVENWR